MVTSDKGSVWNKVLLVDFSSLKYQFFYGKITIHVLYIFNVYILYS